MQCNTEKKTEKRVIKFYLDNAVNNIKKDKIYKFLSECQEVQNQLFKYYWDNNNFKVILECNNKIDFNYKVLNFREVKPRLKAQHYQQVAQQTFANLKAIQTDIIKKIHFKFDNKEKQRIYNYCSGFCFDWIYLLKYVKKQLKAYKNKDNKYYNFLLKLSESINNEQEFNIIKTDIEIRFWELKDKYKCPQKREFQIHCNTAHTVKVELKEFQWIFTIDNNEVVGGTEKKAIYGNMVIPVKFSSYHKEKLQNKKLANTFILRLNVRKQIEIIAVYEEEIEYPIPKEDTTSLGIDIGLKKLITTSEGEVINQNPKVIRKLDKLLNKQANRRRLEYHMQKKLNDDNYKLSDNRYLVKQAKLTEFVLNDNRFKIKRFFDGLQDFNIVIEDLDLKESKTHSKRVNYLLRRLHIQQIKNDIIKYAKQFGIQVTQINAAYTSQQCSKCGHTSKENRKVQETFCCTKCGFTTNADYNASVNIKERIHNKLINLKTPVWRVKEILNVT